MKVVKIIESDAKEVADLINRTSLISLKDCFPQELLIEWIAIHKRDIPKEIHKYNFYGFKVGDKIKGIICYNKNELVRFFIDPEYQRKGYGAKLYYFIEKIIISDGYQEIVVDAGPKGVPAYEKFGFKKIKKKYKTTESGIKYYDTLMKKDISEVL